MNHQETLPYGLRDFTLGVVSSWDLDDVMDSKVMKKCRKSAERHRPRGVWDGASPAGIWKIRSSGKPGRRPASRQRSEDHDTKVPGQPLTTFSQTACNAINTIWELQALNIPVIYEKEGIKTCSPDAETLIDLSAAFAKAESGPARKVAGSISKLRTPAGKTGGSPFSICSE